MRGTTLKVAVGAAAVALFAAACSSGGGDQTPSDTGGELRIYNAEPAFLTPSNGNDQPSIHVIRQLYRGLAKYNAETGAVELDLAESITSTDQKTWTIKIKSGHKFTNGEPVNADAFIRAWNYTAYGPNAQNNSYFMGRIVGFNDMQSGADPDGDGPQKGADPKATEFTGLKKVDDLTFTVELTGPFSGFPTIVGYSGFFPMADACVKAIEACNNAPIGNGPYKIEGTWEHNVGITLVRNETFAGTPGKADKLSYKIFADVDAGYAAFQAGELDLMYTVPAPRYKEAKATYGDRMYEVAGNSFTYVGMPVYLDQFKNKLIRQALSLSIDRQPIIDAVFDGRFTPATGFIAPTFEGARADVCKYCKQDTTKAKDLLAQAGGWPAGVKLQLWANAGAGHERWLQAVGDQIKTVLGIDYELKVNLQFAEYLETADENKFTGPFRLGWGPDYAYLETFLTPLYFTNSSSNYSGYANPAYDALITQGDAAPTSAEAIKLYQQAEDILGEELPVIPMWFNKEASLYSEKVDKFVWNVISDIDYHEVTVKKTA
jgi:peptide/nickel transport system substrate-binding protein